MESRAHAWSKWKMNETGWNRDLQIYAYMIAGMVTILLAGLVAWNVLIHKAYGIRAEGVVIRSGAEDGMSSSAREDKDCMIEAYVSASDVKKMHVDDPVQIAVNGLSPCAYGNLRGSVRRIEEIPVTMEDRQMFKIHILSKGSHMVSRNGKRVSLATGTGVTVRVFYARRSYLGDLLKRLSRLLFER